ncbi:hypothetical protein D3C72_1718580 [compost metagenome]
MPLYGTCAKSVPVWRANSTLVRWSMVPLPDDPIFSLPGCFFSSSTKAAAESARTPGLTMRTSGTFATDATGVKILPGSSLSLPKSAGEIAMDELL